MDLAY